MIDSTAPALADFDLAVGFERHAAKMRRAGIMYGAGLRARTVTADELRQVGERIVQACQGRAPGTEIRTGGLVAMVASGGEVVLVGDPCLKGRSRAG